MAITMRRICDFPMGCENDAPNKVELTAGNVVYRVDVCDEHEDDIVNSLRDGFNFRPVSAWVNGQRRDAHIAKSGRVFTTADVRQWAVDQGLKTGSKQGRVSLEHIELYASEH